MYSHVCCEAPGASNLRRGESCQDRTFYAGHAGAAAVALADGAGSASHAAAGAACAAQEAAKLLAERFDSLCDSGDEEIRDALLGQLLAALDAEAAGNGCSRGDLASTLLCAALKGGRYLAAHIGDGVIGCFGEGKAFVLSKPENGEYLNETVFVTSPHARASLRIYRGEGADGFLLMSDGAAESLYIRRTGCFAPAVRSFFVHAALLPGPVMQARMQQTLGEVISAMTDDDCSVALLVKREGFERELEKLGVRDRYLVLGVARENRRQLEGLLEILRCLSVPMTLPSLARAVHVRKDALRRRLERLERLGFVRREGGLLTRCE